jgi:hypothetical protein
MFRLIHFFGIDSIWNWLRPTVEGDDGKASARRLSAYVIMILFILGNIQAFYVIKDKDLVFDVLILDAVFILVLFGILTIQNVITLYRIKNNQDSQK